jgi:hypothetical protein
VAEHLVRKAGTLRLQSSPTKKLAVTGSDDASPGNRTSVPAAINLRGYSITDNDVPPLLPGQRGPGHDRNGSWLHPLC